MRLPQWTFLFAAILLAPSAVSATLVDAFVGAPVNPDTTRTNTFAQAGFGFYANPNGTTTINSLGFWVSPANSGNTGVLAVDHDIALYHYNGSNYTQIAAATVLAGSTADANGYAWASIPTLTLSDTRQGADYYIVTAEMDTDVWAPNTGSAHAPILNATFGTRTGLGWYAETSAPGIGNSFGPFTQVPNDGYYGPNVGMAVVPEPSSLALLGFAAITTIGMLSRRGRYQR